MKLRLTRMTVGLVLGVTAAVVVSCGLGAYFASRLHFTALLESERKTAMARGELIRTALEQQMMENDRSLIGRMIETFGREPDVERVVLFDAAGHVRFAGGAPASAQDLAIGSPACQACHSLPSEQRSSSRVVEAGGGSILRSMIPIVNHPQCHRCHDSNQRINGVLMVDLDIGPMRAKVNRDLRWLATGSGALMLLLLAAVGGLYRLVVVRRLRRFETTARLIAAGDLERRVPAQGSDTIAWLANEFNTMADSMAGLVSEVRDERERLETVINAIDDGIVVLSPGRTVTAANEAFLQRVGRSREEVLGTSCHEVAQGMCGPGDCPTLGCFQTAERQVRICERRTASGKVVWEEVHASPIQGRGAGVGHVVEVWRDISSRRAAEAQLAESHRLASLGMLASGFSHELNTPLATTLACVEGILRTAQSDEHQERDGWARVGDSARIAREQLLRSRGITHHFLRLASGKSLPPSVVDLTPTFSAVARLIEPTAASHQVKIRVEPPGPGCRVWVNDAELQHLLLNLLLNAVEACPPGGTVRLGAEAGTAVVIRVSDDGCGIAPENQKRIFEPFFSLKEGGTGLGLFLSLGTVHRCGGEIRLRSAPGQGSTFEVSLPAAGTGVPVEASP